ncbi:hypothetical protein BH11ARM2_BH11ARM2_26420 [soil metagenome]
MACDRAYGYPRIRRWLEARGVEPAIPRRRNERPAPEEPFDQEAHRGRNAVERLVGRLKETRGFAARSDKLAESFLATTRLAMIRILLRRLVPSNTA